MIKMDVEYAFDRHVFVYLLVFSEFCRLTSIGVLEDTQKYHDFPNVTLTIHDLHASCMRFADAARHVYLDTGI